MQLKPLDVHIFESAAEWLGQKENYQWLDFGCGLQRLPLASLNIMTQRDIHLLRIFTPDAHDTPIGLVALSNIARNFRTATLWYVLGDKSYAGQGYTSRAVSQILGIGFQELGLQSVSAWAVELNQPSIRVLLRNGFRPVGRQRQCHGIGNSLFDRLLFDLLAHEYEEMLHVSSV
jgi:RimJ/RimL family protein N-acetyltransferase